MFIPFFRKLNPCDVSQLSKLSYEYCSVSLDKRAESDTTSEKICIDN